MYACPFQAFDLKCTIPEIKDVGEPLLIYLDVRSRPLLRPLHFAPFVSSLPSSPLPTILILFFLATSTTTGLTYRLPLALPPLAPSLPPLSTGLSPHCCTSRLPPPSSLVSFVPLSTVVVHSSIPPHPRFLTTPLSQPVSTYPSPARRRCFFYHPFTCPSRSTRRRRRRSRLPSFLHILTSPSFFHHPSCKSFRIAKQSGFLSFPLSLFPLATPTAGADLEEQTHERDGGGKKEGKDNQMHFF